MKVRKILFLIPTPLTQRDYERFGVERLNSRGFTVGFLDLTELLNPEYRSNVFCEAACYNDIVSISSEENFDSFFAGCDSSRILVINLMGEINTKFFMLDTFEKYKIIYANFTANSIPVPVSGKCRSIMQVGLGRKLIDFTRKKVSSLFSTAFTPRFVLAGGLKCTKKFLPLGKNAEIIWAHTLDYDRYLDYQSDQPETLVEGDYMVFLDEYFPLHPDHYASNIHQNPYDDYRQYYDELNRQFSYLEDIMGMPVVIAAHPKSQYDDKSDLLKGRQVFKMKTVGLVAKAKCVLAHGSTSINFPVLFKKPIIFLIPSRARKGYYGQFISGYAKLLGKRALTTDIIADIDRDKELTVNNDLYCAYKENYIKRSSSSSKFFWDIVADAVVNSSN